MKQAVNPSSVSPCRESVVPYDFRRPVTLSREHARTLQAAFVVWARQASTLFSSALRETSQVELESVEQVAYADYVDQLCETSHLVVFTAEPFSGLAALQLPLRASMLCVDRLLGGSGAVDQPERPLTDLEASVVADLHHRLIGQLGYAFASVADVSARPARTEYYPQNARFAHATDAMVVARFRLQHRDEQLALSLCFPFAGLLPGLKGAAAQVSESERRTRAAASVRLAETFEEVPVDVVVRFRHTDADPVELSGLQVGDVVRLAHAAQAPLDVATEDVVLAHATPGSHGRRLAALVVASPTQEN
jgi:flagellar motor switch protein FliM